MRNILIAAGLLVLAFAGGFAVRGMQERATLARARIVQDSTLYAVTVQHGRLADSLRRVGEAAAARQAAAVGVADRLRREAAGHARADAGQDSALAAARTDAERVPILTAQRDAARAGYALLALAGDSLRAGLAAAEDRLAIKEAQRVADSMLYISRENSLRALNDGLAQEVARLRGGTKWLGFLPVPSRGLMLVVGLAAGYAVAQR
jgi:hypothetical protein